MGVCSSSQSSRSGSSRQRGGRSLSSRPNASKSNTPNRSPALSGVSGPAVPRLPANNFLDPPTSGHGDSSSPNCIAPSGATHSLTPSKRLSVSPRVSPKASPGNSPRVAPQPVSPSPRAAKPAKASPIARGSGVRKPRRPTESSPMQKINMPKKDKYASEDSQGGSDSDSDQYLQSISHGIKFKQARGGREEAR